MVVGVSGKYCAGKGEISKILCRRGFLHVDVDFIGHKVLKLHRQHIATVFGDAVLTPNREDIDRRVLGSIVFSDKKKLETLESIIHPPMREEVRSFLGEHPHEHVVIDAAVLFPLELDRYCHLIIWVEAHLLLRMYRAKRRDKKTLAQIRSIMNRQKILAAQSSSLNADIYIVRNSLGLKPLREQIETIMLHYKRE